VSQNQVLLCCQGATINKRFPFVIGLVFAAVTAGLKRGMCSRVLRADRGQMPTQLLDPAERHFRTVHHGDGECEVTNVKKVEMESRMQKKRSREMRLEEALWSQAVQAQPAGPLEAVVRLRGRWI
jgi:hypothetical protein